MKVGIIHEARRYVVEGENRNRFQLYNFTISTEQLSLFRIFYSAFGTPARYVMELFRRLHLIGDDGCPDGCFIFNPLLELGPETVERTLNYIANLATVESPIVVTDRHNLPIGYYLPAGIRPGEERYLSLLSGIDGHLDQNFLNICYFANGAVTLIDESQQDSRGNGFFMNEDIATIYKWTTVMAISLLGRVFPKKMPAAPYSGSMIKENDYYRRLRDALKFCSIMPHHAGDVLFYALAANNVPDSHFDKIVINHRYAGIMEDVSPGYKMQMINPLPPYRDGNISTDEQNFMCFASDLPLFNFYYYCRQVRNYNASEFHLIDHFGFALGKSFLNTSDLIMRTKSDPPLFKSPIPIDPYRVLLHFDAGWGLKIYPVQYQKELIRSLLAAGVEVTVLGTEDRDFGTYRSVSFKDLKQFKGLLRSHHLLVGSDSFPSHYAAHVQGVPIICLFGPTKPANSNARISGHYLYLENGMKCRPCCYMEVCTPQNKAFCENFVPPDRVFSEIQAMLASNYK